MSNYIFEINDANFEKDVLNHRQQPVLVDFWAPWCGPCKMVAPVIEDLAAEYKDQLKIVKINVDKNRQYAGQLKVMGIPTLVLFKDGQEVDRVVGFRSKEDLKQIIDKQLS